MKDLSIYFESNKIEVDHSANHVGGLIQGLDASGYQVPTAKSIALIYVPDYRKSLTLESSGDWIDDFRVSISALFGGDWTAEIYDLGVIKPGETTLDTYAALNEVVSELIKEDVFPVVIGGSQDLTFPMYQAYEKLEQTINLMAVDASLDMGDPEEDISATGWLNKIVLHKPNYLFNFSLVGYQSYLTSPKEIELLNDLYFDAFRLGDFYTNDRMVEPLLRNADLLSFDMDVIRSSDYKSNGRDLPNGLYGEDACRMMRYAGISDKLTSLGLFNFCPNGHGYKSDVNLLAQMVWYFVEGYNLRKSDYPISSKASYLKYRVNIDDFKDEIIFYKSNKSSRWWMEVPYPKIQGVKLQRHLLVPCNYEDYENALNNELPDLWLRTYKKLS
jgi:arginase family enzyme